jgi:hypothetical protein
MGCPVSRATQEWIESSMRWCTGEFGKEPLLRGIVLPTAAFLPSSYTATAEQIDALVKRVCDLMLVGRAALKLDLFDGSAEKERAKALKSSKSHTVGHFHMEDGYAVIGLDRSESADPAHLTAIIAHELCHVKLLGEGRIAASRRDHERLTDLLTVYFGFGIFSANAALSYSRNSRGWSVHPLGYLDERTLNAARNDGYRRLGYLSEQEFGYALACYGWLREETDPRWAAYLDLGPRAYLNQGLAYLADPGPGKDLPTQRTLNKTLRYGNATIRVVSAPAQRPSPLGFVLPVTGIKPGHDESLDPGDPEGGR